MVYLSVAVLILLAATLLLVAIMRLMHPLPSLDGRRQSRAFTDTDNTLLARKLTSIRRRNRGLSGVHIITEGHEAFAARRALAKAASRCIDVQYYIWNGDMTGKLLILDLLEAANRGVRVRILLDDNPTAGLDALWSAVNSHENVEVRLFNPFTIRWPRIFNYVTDFKRLNRRMHNKSFTVDSQATIVGGRNIGDEYFNATDQLQFADMDVLAVGTVVQDVALEFDRYWSSASSYPIERLVSVSSREIEAQQKVLADTGMSADGRAYAEMAQGTRLVGGLISGKLRLDWVKAELVCDDPAKGLGSIARRSLLVTGLTRALGEANESLDAATAYFVPGRMGANFFRRLVRSGRKVRIFTNSLASTDVAPVHAGYARYRRRLLRAGVRLFEMKPLGGPREHALRSPERKFPRLGSSRSSLHAKLFLVDRQRLFIGSFNFDPRSVYLNCEMGIMITSPAIGEQVGHLFDQLTEQSSFEPLLGRLGRLHWIDKASPTAGTVLTEPESTWRQRLTVGIISWLPVEWLL